MNIGNSYQLFSTAIIVIRFADLIGQETLRMLGIVFKCKFLFLSESKTANVYASCQHCRVIK